jgi:hypothetical protein
MGWVVVVRLLHLVQDVSRMSKRRQAECAMMMPGLAHVLVLLSRIVGTEQPPKPKQKSLNHSKYKHIQERHTCLSRTAATSTTQERLGRCAGSISSLVWGMPAKSPGGSSSAPPNWPGHCIASALNFTIKINEENCKHGTYFQK